jgi:hypothetical protein
MHHSLSIKTLNEDIFTIFMSIFIDIYSAIGLSISLFAACSMEKKFRFFLIPPPAV